MPESAEQTTRGRRPWSIRARTRPAMVAQRSGVETLVPPNLRTTQGLTSPTLLSNPHPLAPSPVPSHPPSPGEGESPCPAVFSPLPVREGGRGRERGRG